MTRFNYQERAIIEVLSHNNWFKTSDIVFLANLKQSSVEHFLRKLLERGLISQRKSGNGIKEYTLNKGPDLSKIVKGELDGYQRLALAKDKKHRPEN